MMSRMESVRFSAKAVLHYEVHSKIICKAEENCSEGTGVNNFPLPWF